MNTNNTNTLSGVYATSLSDVDFNKSNVKELRKKTGMTQQAFGDYFGIPKRTIQDWEYERRQCNDYIFNLMVYKLQKEKMI